MAKYRLLTKMFIEPNMYGPGTELGDTIEYDGPPNLDMVPLDTDAEKALDDYKKSRPADFAQNPVEALPKKVATAIVVPPPEKATPVAAVPRGGK